MPQSSQEWIQANSPQGQPSQCTEKLLNVKVCDSTIRKELNDFGRVSKREPSFSIKKLAAEASVCKVNKPQHIQNNVQWGGQMRPKWICLAIINMFIVQTKHRISAQTSQINCPAQSRGGAMIWAYFATTGPGHYAVIES